MSRIVIAFDVDAPTDAEAIRRLGMWLPPAGTTWRKPGTESLRSWAVVATTPPESPYDACLRAEQACSDLGVTTSQIDLANTIRRVVDDYEPGGEPLEEYDADQLVRRAYDHFVDRGGVDYDTAVGELLWHEVRDRVSDAMEAEGFLP